MVQSTGITGKPGNANTASVDIPRTSKPYTPTKRRTGFDWPAPPADDSNWNAALGKVAKKVRKQEAENKRRKEAKSTTAHATLPSDEFKCSVCRTPLTQRPGETPQNFARRKTCGSPECLGALRKPQQHPCSTPGCTGTYARSSTGQCSKCAQRTYATEYRRQKRDKPTPRPCTTPGCSGTYLYSMKQKCRSCAQQGTTRDRSVK